MVRVLIAEIPQNISAFCKFAEKKVRSLNVIKYDSNRNREYINNILNKGSEKARLSSLIGIILLDELLLYAKTTDCELFRDKNRRPYIKCNTPLDFNISHTENFVVCALHTEKMSRVGIDIEKIGGHKDEERLISRFFSDGEIAFYKNSDDKSLAFSSLWTRKEAYLKYTGIGIGKGFSESDVTTLTGVIFTSKEYKNNIITVCTKSENNIEFIPYELE